VQEKAVVRSPSPTPHQHKLGLRLPTKHQGVENPGLSSTKIMSDRKRANESHSRSRITRWSWSACRGVSGA